jgi:hypothetical protein
MVAGQTLEFIENLLRDEKTLLDPTLHPFGRAHLDKTLFAVEDFHLVAILDVSDFVVDLGDAVAQKRLRRRNVHHLARLTVPPASR